MDFDTGKPTAQNEYGLADQTYSLLVLKLKDKKFNEVTYPLQNNILSFYGKGDTISMVTEQKKYKIDWQKTYAALQQLRVAKPIPIDSLKYPADSLAKAAVIKTK
jgi:vancomycin resistance protein YoaR